MLNHPTLYLIPVPLGNMDDPQGLQSISVEVRQIAFNLNHFAVENEKSARAFLKNIQYPKPIREAHLCELSSQLELAQNWLKEGHSVGILSEAGCPGIADPGSLLVEWAHENRIPVKPLVGPSSILLALMASGLSGQNFSFEGYLPILEAERKSALQNLEKISQKENRTILFIETPYRNESLYKTLIETLRPQTQLCLATDLTLLSEWIKTHRVKEWKSQPHVGSSIQKRPTLFLFNASS